MIDLDETDKESISAAGRKAAGISALRKIRQCVEEEARTAQTKALWAKRILIVAGGLIFLLVFGYLLRKI